MIHISDKWSLFLDRDGVINEKIDNDYVKTFDEFLFKPKVLTSLKDLSKIFNRIFIITNQRGVGLNIMTRTDLDSIHEQMLKLIEGHGGRIDYIFSCIDQYDSSPCRKPNIGMGNMAKELFPEIEFSKSIIVGDSECDIQFGNRLGMISIYLGEEVNKPKSNCHYKIQSLADLNKLIIKENK